MKKNKIHSFWIYLFLGGFLVGILLMNAGCDVLLTEEGIFAPSDISRLQYLDIEGGRFFPYVLRKRIQSMLIPVLLSATIMRSMAVYGCLIWQGIIMGMTIAAAIIRFGIKGILLILAGIFPHQFLLFPAMIMLLVWCCENCNVRGRYIRKGTKQHMSRMVSLIWICFMTLIGCVLESYVNPLLVSDILKIF